MSIYNPSLREEPRSQRAGVIPLKQEDSILDWLEATGRLLSRDDPEHNYQEDEEEISELIVDDGPYDDDDDDLVEEDVDLIPD